jgi:hypothetical protein
VIYRCRLAFALAQGGDGRGAAAAYRAALEQDRSWPEAFAARAWQLATDPDEDRRDPRLADEMAGAAVEAAGDPSAMALAARAAAAAALGRHTEAAEAARQSLDKADAGAFPLGSAVREQLRRYKDGTFADPHTHTSF